MYLELHSHLLGLSGIEQYRVDLLVLRQEALSSHFRNRCPAFAVADEDHRSCCYMELRAGLVLAKRGAAPGLDVKL